MNSAFYPTLMWNSRFRALSGDPFDNRKGFLFPTPEGLKLSNEPHLLAAQAFIPPTERTEVTGFEFEGGHHAIRAEVLYRLNAIPAYRRLFGRAFEQVKRGAPIDFDMFGQAIAEFEFTLTFANAPLDRFARGERAALTNEEKKGALLFLGKARCVECHGVAGASNEMFSDFQEHVIGVPQIVPDKTNNVFDGPDANQDFGKEQVTGDRADRYMFRTSPLRNVALQPTFMHNGAFTRLEDAVRHHLDVVSSIKNYSPSAQDLAQDLRGPLGPMDPVLKRIDPLVATRMHLSEEEVGQLVAFVRNGLLDPRARYSKLKHLIPNTVPSGRPVLVFESP
jgi:cytochrome c peroxidase